MPPAPPTPFESNGDHRQREYDPLSEEFARLTANLPASEKVKIAANLSLFCSELESLPPERQKAEVDSFLQAHHLLQDLREYFDLSYDQDQQHLRQRFDDIYLLAQSTIHELFSSEDPSRAIAMESVCDALNGQTALCLGSHRLSGAIREFDRQIEQTIIHPFRNRVEDDHARIDRLIKSDNLSTPLQAKAVKGLLDIRARDAENILEKINARIEDITEQFPLLVMAATSDMHHLFPTLSDQYLLDLSEFIEDHFQGPFNQRVGEIVTGKKRLIRQELQSLFELTPPSSHK
jgi:hypothetical protein